ncbi:MAG: glycosyltransferase, partial [Candidatus Hodarchaeota archaeon]
MLEAIAELMNAGYEFYRVWSPLVHEISLSLYNVLFFPMLFFSSLFYIMAFSGIFAKPKAIQIPKISNWPKVTVQIPTLNEIVALRCAKKCLEFDYPKNKFEIIIGDDSNDPQISKSIDNFAAKHPQVRITRRKVKEGFKAGNLNHMLRYSKGDIIVTFDSDFIPPRDFLKRVLPPFVKEKKLGCVQTKWKYINMKQNIVTKFASSVLMLYHNLLACINSRAGVSLLFGSGQAVRKNLLIKLGAWQNGSLTEDVEFSLRVLKAGYKIHYLSDFSTPGEVPFTTNGFFKQQKKWAYGNARAFLDHRRWILFG